jgi:uncharacterized protein YraI
MQKYGIVNTDLLNLRSGPSTTANILKQLPNGTVLQLVSDPGFDWLEVKTNDTGIRGYVAKQFLKLTDTLPGAAPAPTTTTPPATTSPAPATTSPSTNTTTFIGKAEVTTDTLNIRTGPGTTFSIITAVPRGTVLNVIANQGAWIKVKIGGNEGFASAQYLNLNTTKAPTGYLIEQSDLLTANLIPTKLIPNQANGTQEAVVARTWNNYGGLLQKLATIVNCPLNGIVATITAESGGNCFGPDGRMIIRFENHIFWSEWGKNNVTQFNQFFKFDPISGWKEHMFRSTPDGTFQYFHGKQASEYQVLTVARALNDNAALQSISMGAAQIMGFHYKRLGYDSVQTMFYQLSRSANAQLLSMFDFVRGTSSDAPAITALRKADYYTFALNYNGSGNAETYRNIISTYAKIFDKLIPTAK